VEVLVHGRAVLLRATGGCLFEGHFGDARLALATGTASNGTRALPDPVSRSQPEGMHGPSEVVDAAAFPWSDRVFRGHQRRDLVAYELHVGTFTEAGTFEAVIPRLPRTGRPRGHGRPRHLDTSPVHILTELAAAAREEAMTLGRRDPHTSRPRRTC
jgi:hypothetical protein